MNNPLGRFDNVVIQEMDGEILIYDLQSNKAFGLNETSAMVWRLCNGKNSVADIVSLSDTRLKSGGAASIVWLALDQLSKNKLLVDNDSVEPIFNGLTRREVVRNAGLASMIALPVITSLVAPRPVSAQSVAAPCTAPAMGTTGAMFGGCTDVNAAACLANCNGPFSGVTLICCSGAATAESCAPSGPNVMCICTCT